MLIYRIERKDNPMRGAFQVDCADVAREQALYEGVFNPYNHPGPELDGDLPTAGHHHGFQSLEIYRIWFVTPTVRAALYRNGKFHMRVYDVPDHLVNVGMVQVTFKLGDAVDVRLATPEEMA